MSEQSSHSKFSQLGMALLSYHEDHLDFPSSKFEKKEGGPMHSWRIMLLPYMNTMDGELFKLYDFSKKWDSQDNMNKLGQQVPVLFALDKKAGITNFVTIGPGEEWPTKSPLKSRLVVEGDDRFLLVEYPDSSIFWMEPKY